MADSKQEGATKGSQLQLQRIVNERPEELNALILGASPTLLAFGARGITWRSPLKEPTEGTAYYEYRDDFLKPLGLEDRESKLREFWPSKGPRWDGLAIVDSPKGSGYLLVEAKAHGGEANSESGAKASDSVAQIEAALKQTQKYMHVPAGEWTKPYYQLANRLAFLYFMNIELELPTWLVLINFVADTTHLPTELGEWLEKYREMYKKLRIGHDSPLTEKVVCVFPKAV